MIWIFGKYRRCNIMTCKVSRYNYITKYDNDYYLIMNLLQGPGSMRVIPVASNELVDLLSKSDTIVNDSTIPDLEKFKNLGYLIDEEKNEILAVKDLYNNIIYDNSLSLIIMSTGQCNFRCKYCYEDFKKGAMSEDVQRRVLKYIQKQLNYFTRISIEWFGGEPLMGLNSIENILKQDNKLCAVKKAYYRSTMTTNAFLLTPDVFKKLYDLRVFAYQITLDGAKEQHDTQRVLRNGQGTYDRIISNLLFIRDNKNYNKVKITLRINVTKPIADHLSEFLTFYKQEFSNDNRFSLLFREAGNLGGDNIAQFEDNLLAKGNMNVNDLLKAHKLFDNPEFNLTDPMLVLTPMSNLCYASRKNSFVIDSEGLVYKCTVHFDDKCNQLGYLDENGNIILNQYAHSLWYMNKKEFPPVMCYNCKFLPVCCGGSCTYHTHFAEKEDCCGENLTRHVEDYMKYYANRTKIETI